MKFAPTNRLVLFAAILCPAALLAPLNTVLLGVAAALYGALLVVAWLDWLTSRQLLADISVEVAAVTRMSLGNMGKVELFIRRIGPKLRRFNLALGLDKHLESEQAKLPIELAAEG